MQLPKPKSPPGIFLYLLSASAIAVALRVLWVLVGQNVETLSIEKGYDKLLSRHWSEVVAWMTENIFWLTVSSAGLVSGAVCCWVYAALVDHDRKPLIEQTRVDLSGLADRARRASAGINKIMSEYNRKPPVHPDYKFGNGDTERWMRDGYESDEKALRLYLTEWAAECWEIIEIAGKYVDLSERDLFQFRHMSSHSIAEVAQFMARIAGKLEQVQPSQA
ncbi:hypothetical protein BSL82_06670 [Tardibacter chloracetimidivorans]|uniref:DUF4760 domain-containing protein n=1 Tax=Tardibacter chloracetimidivorans TaxID=1921510 RepID=A0A1L3ZTS2_9SPHN|nr:hypothetical protein [Tardibacter chloracetimidivorans]API59033.1 hypothetical protein BSL82_06670 [Tardibacter chloracetimidivorans]